MPWRNASRRSSSASRTPNARRNWRNSARSRRSARPNWRRSRRSSRRPNRRLEAERKRKAELEAKKKAELEAKQKAEQAAKQKAAAEAKKEGGKRRRRKKAEAEAKKKAAAEAKRKAEEAQRREAEQALQSQLAAEQAGIEAARVQSVVAEYIGYIQERIQRSWLRPPGSPAGLSCVVQVGLIPGGEVARVQIVRSSGDAVFDRSVESAVYKASPLPLPPDAALFKHFRELRLIFKPN